MIFDVAVSTANSEVFGRSADIQIEEKDGIEINIVK